MCSIDEPGHSRGENNVPILFFYYGSNGNSNLVDTKPDLHTLDLLCKGMLGQSVELGHSAGYFFARVC